MIIIVVIIMISSLSIFRLWTVSKEKELNRMLQENLGSQLVDLKSLEDILHSKDYYGKDQVSAPQLRSSLRSVGVILEKKVISALMQATDIYGKGSYFIPSILDILDKSFG